MKKLIIVLLYTITLMAEQMYTQVGMWYEEGKSYSGKANPSYAKVLAENSPVKRDLFSGDVSTVRYMVKTDLLINGTNFSRGTYIPVNTSVNIVSIDQRFIFFKLENKIIMTFNVKKYTRLSSKSFFQRQFKNTKVDLSSYSQEVKQNILQGRVKKGMSKSAVLLARGYPPMHMTPELDSNRWQYWEESAHSHYYYFVDEKFDGNL